FTVPSIPHQCRSHKVARTPSVGLAFCLGPWYITLVVGRYSPAYGTRSPSICARPATDSVQARARRANVGRASGRMDMGHPQAFTKRVVASYPPKLAGTSVTLRR